jgi:hypothetical protein
MFDIISSLAARIGTDPKIVGTLIAAVLVVIAGKVLQKILAAGVHVWKSRKAYDLAGYWIGECNLPSYSKPALEIWRYTRSGFWRNAPNGDHVSLKFFAYTPDSRQISQWLGGGVWRGTKLSGYYYRYDKFTFESGVIALELKALTLRGAYAQFDVNHPAEPLYVSDANYVQCRIKQLPAMARLKMHFGYPPFASYAHVKALQRRNA